MRKSKVKAAEAKYERVKKTSKPGTGKRFSALKDKFMAQGDSPNKAEAKSAAIGRKKYGAKKMASMAAKGRKK